ncbi:MAG: alanine racemase [Methylocystis sp.]
MHAHFKPATDQIDPSETSRLTIDLSALAQNWRRLAKCCAPAKCSAVVKANAYGLGLEPVMRALRAAGCEAFFVASVSEGERARALSRDAIVYVLDGVAPGSAPRLRAARLRPVLNSLAEIGEWADAGPSALHFDTGMNRLGLPPAEAAAASAAATPPALVMSHFVSAESSDDPRNAIQIEAFAAIAERFPGVPASLCNSSGIFLPSKPHLDLVRPGYALYGGNPTPRQINPMRAVSRLEARVLAIHEIAAGESVGYDATWTAMRPTRLATIAAGYADGLPVSASSGASNLPAEVLLAGARCPVVGRVSMDYVVLDATDAGVVERGDWAVILGENIGVDELAARAGTIGYEILTRLGSRYARRYVGS